MTVSKLTENSLSRARLPTICNGNGVYDGLCCAECRHVYGHEIFVAASESPNTGRIRRTGWKPHLVHPVNTGQRRKERPSYGPSAWRRGRFGSHTESRLEHYALITILTFERQYCVNVRPLHQKSHSITELSGRVEND